MRIIIETDYRTRLSNCAEWNLEEAERSRRDGDIHRADRLENQGNALWQKIRAMPRV